MRGWHVCGVSCIAFGIEALTLAIPQGSAAQSIWGDHGQRHSLALEFVKTNYASASEGVFDSSTFSSLISGRLAVGTGFLLTAEVPYASVTLGEDSGLFSPPTDESGFGNVYVGIERWDRTGRMYFEGGVRLPTMADDLEIVPLAGSYADFERLGAFIPENMNVNLLVNYRPFSSSGVGARIRFGPSFLIPTGDASSDTDVLLYGGVLLLLENAYIDFKGGLSALTNVTDEDAFHSPASAVFAGLSLAARIGVFRPGVHIRAPVGGNVADVVTANYSLLLSFVFDD